MTRAAHENGSDQVTGEARSRGVMTDEERALLLELLCASRDAFLSELRRVSPDDWAARHRDGQWSIAQCAEHVVVSEEALRRLVREQILTSPASPDKASAVQGKDGIVVQAMRDRSQRTKTSTLLEPTGRWPHRAALIEQFEKERSATIAYVRSTCDRLHAHTSAIQPFGDLDAFQWLLLLAAHTTRHVAQIEEVRSALRLQTNR
jgi:hypothetical protein